MVPEIVIIVVFIVVFISRLSNSIQEISPPGVKDKLQAWHTAHFLM